MALVQPGGGHHGQLDHYLRAYDAGKEIGSVLKTGFDYAKDLYESYGIGDSPQQVNVIASGSDLSTPQKNRPAPYKVPQKKGRTEAPPTQSAAETSDRDPSDNNLDAEMPDANGTTGPSTSSTEFNDVSVIHPVASVNQEKNVRSLTFKKLYHYCIPITSTEDFKTYTRNDGTIVATDGHFMVPYKSSYLYMTTEEHSNLLYKYAAFKVNKASFKMSNFTSHSAILSGTGTSTLQMHYGGIGWNSTILPQSFLGPHACIDKDAKILSHREIFEKSPNPGEYAPYDFKFLRCLDYLGRDYLANDTDHDPTIMSTPRLESYSTYQLGAPYHTSMEVMPTEKRWYMSPIYGKANTAISLTKFGALTGAQKVNQMRNWPRALQRNQAPPVGTGRYSGHDKDGNTYWGGVNEQATVPYIHDNGFNIITTNAQPAMKFNMWSDTGTGNTTADPKQGAATTQESPVFLFKPVIPPSIDNSDPNLMVCFTLETELTVSVLDCDSNPSNDAYMSRLIIGKPDGEIFNLYKQAGRGRIPFFAVPFMNDQTNEDTIYMKGMDFVPYTDMQQADYKMTGAFGQDLTGYAGPGLDGYNASNFPNAPLQ